MNSETVRCDAEDFAEDRGGAAGSGSLSLEDWVRAGKNLVRQPEGALRKFSALSVQAGLENVEWRRGCATGYLFFNKATA